MIQNYSEDSIQTLDWKEHIRRRPGMYIGKLGDGTYGDDGIYVLLKEVMDNSIDEYMMGFGKKIEVRIDENRVSVRDYGRGIPLGKVVDVVSKMNTGAKYDSKAFKKSVGLNGVGVKAVNALSVNFKVQAFREGETKLVSFSREELVAENPIESTQAPNGTLIEFWPDDTIFDAFTFKDEFIEDLLKNYTYLNAGLAIHFNGRVFQSKRGLLDLLEENMTEPGLYAPIQLKDDDLEIALTHTNQYGEEYYTFVNGQHTTQGGTHLIAFRESVVRTIREFYNKNFDVADIRQGIVAAVSIKIEEPVFESQTKTKLGSKDMGPDGTSVRNYIGDFFKTTTRQLSAPPCRNCGGDAQENTGVGEGTQSHLGHSETGPGKGQKGESAQQKVARLPGALQLQCRAQNGNHDFHYRGRLGQRFHHQGQGCDYPGGILAQGKAPELLRPKP